MTIVVDNMQDGYLRAIDTVLKHGQVVAPRGLATREVLGFQMLLTDPTMCFANGVGRKLSPAVAAAEALQLVGGFSDPAAMLKVSPHFEKFLDGGVLHAPYGPRVMPHLQRVVQRLTADPFTRQAVISIWDPVQDLHVDGSRDYPCTTHLQFMGRHNERGQVALDLHVSMRANDAWHGFPYDVFQFAFLQLSLASVLDMPVGRYFHHATSFHLYEAQLEQAVDLYREDVAPRAFTGAWGWSISTMQTRARSLFYGTLPADQPMTAGEAFLYYALRTRGVTGQW